MSIVYLILCLTKINFLLTSPAGISSFMDMLSEIQLVLLIGTRSGTTFVYD